MSTLSWSLLKLRRLSQLFFVKSLMSHLGWWLGCVCPQNGTRVLHDGDAQTRGFRVSTQSFSINRYLCWLRAGDTWRESNKLLSNALIRNTRSCFAGQTWKDACFLNVCTFSYTNIEPGWMHKNTKHCLSKELECGLCSSINGGFLLSWVQLFPIEPSAYYCDYMCFDSNMVVISIQTKMHSECILPQRSNSLLKLKIPGSIPAAACLLLIHFAFPVTIIVLEPSSRFCRNL